MGKIFILCSAIWYKDLPSQKFLPSNCERGVVVCGRRHNDIIHTVLTLTGRKTITNGKNAVGEHIQGFLTSNNKFVDRKEASIISYNSGQTKNKKKYIFSEDLW